MSETSGGPWPGMQLSYLSKLGFLGKLVSQVSQYLTMSETNGGHI